MQKCETESQQCFALDDCTDDGAGGSRSSQNEQLNNNSSSRPQLLATTSTSSGGSLMINKDILSANPSKEPELDLVVPYHYKPGTLTDLITRTKFNKRELQMLYRGFKQTCPNGIVDITQFKAIYQQFFPQGDPSRYAQFVFNTFDTDGSGAISFDEFCVGLSVLSRGTFDEKMMWIYKLYDIDNDGLLKREDIFQLKQEEFQTRVLEWVTPRVVASMYSMMGCLDVFNVDRRDIQDHVDFIFSKMDDNNDGYITEEEFITMGQDKEMQESLACLFNTKFMQWDC